MEATFRKYVLDFKRPSGTSRGVLTRKETWFLILHHQDRIGIGECGMLRGLSADDVPEYEDQLRWTCKNIALGEARLLSSLKAFPSIRFGVEQAFLSFEARAPFRLFESDFLTMEQPIPINGLIWMGEASYMKEQISEKLRAGFHCLKLKIGALDFDKELDLLAGIRKEEPQKRLTIRVDANGSFALNEAEKKIRQLQTYDLHSIEQPIPPGNQETLKQLCAAGTVPVALDEELIGVHELDAKERLLRKIRPQYIVLKPSLLGGYSATMEWIDLAGQLDIGWWITSALESNIGLNAIAQWTATLPITMPQGLGTGSLYTNNFESPLTVNQGNLYYHKTKDWNLNLIDALCI